MNIRDVEIVLVEDSAEDAEMTMMALKEKKISTKILHLEDGAEAIDFLFSQGKYAGNNLKELPKLIILDLKMPKISGSGVLKKVKENELTRHIPVVIMSSSREEKDIEECYRLGANSYVIKPIEYDAYSNAVFKVGSYWLKTNHF